MLKNRVRTFLLLFLLAVACVKCRRVIRAAEHAEKSGCYIVKLRNDTTHEVFEQTLTDALDRSDDFKVYAKSEGVFKFFTVRLPETALDEVKKFENVEYIEEETMASGAATTSSWALDRIDQTSSTGDNTYNPGPGRDGSGVDIYVLDTGIRYDHSEFGGRVKYPGFDTVDEYYNTNQRGADCHGHGTHVSSLAGGSNYGVATKATIYSVRVLQCDNGAPWSTVLNALDKVVDKVKKDNRPAVISMSLGGTFTFAVDDAMQEVTGAGIPVVTAAGNSNGNACFDSPASSGPAITVAGSAKGDGLYYYTSGGGCVDIFAPGASVLGADYKSQSGSLYLSGTSMATPVVSGVLAIYLQEKPSLTVQELTQLLIDNSIKDALDFTRLKTFGLDETTPNRLVQVKNAAPGVTSTSTITNTVTTASTVRVTETPLPSTIYSTQTRLVFQTVTDTNTVTETSTRNIATTVTIAPTTITVTPTPTPGSVGEGECNISTSIDNLKAELTATVEDIIEAGIYLMADIASCDDNTTVENFRVGETESSAARSCQEIATTKPFLKSGDYWVRHPNGSTVLVHCKMEEIEGRKGMMTLAEIDMSKPDSKCPGELNLRTEPMRMCERATEEIGCSTANFSTKGFPYQTVCGRVHGIQFGSPNAFYWYVMNTHFTINDLYVDGAVLSRVNSTGVRSHVWTFTAALDELVRPDHAFACPCTNTDATTTFKIPEFVGDDYFCDTGSKAGFQYGQYYTEDPLWDGQGCGPKSTCCSHGNYFCKTFETVTTDDIELHLCGNENRSNEDTPLTLVELYVQ